MKRISTILLISILLLPQARAQLFRHLGNGVPGRVVAACQDSRQHMSVCYISGLTSLTISTWDPGKAQWTTIRTATGSEGEVYHMTYFNDSLYVYGLVNGARGLFQISPGTIRTMGIFKRAQAGKVSVTDMKVINNHHLLVVGYFDSIYGPSDTLFSSRAALFNGSSWQPTGFSSKYMYQENTVFPSQREFAVLGDTAVILFQNTMYRYVYPNKWTKTTSSMVSQAQNITRVGNKFIYTVPTYDTIYHYIDTNNIEKIATNRRINAFSYFGAHQGRLIMYDRAGSLAVLQPDNTWKDAYYFGDTAKPKFITSNDSHLYVYSTPRIVYRNKDYGAIAEVDLDSIAVYGNDTIIGLVFWDKDNNNVYNQGDITIKNASVKDITYPGLSFISPSNSFGIFMHVIKDYNDIELQLGAVSFDTCLKQSFSGNIKSRNTRPGKTTDSVFFPLKRTSLQTKNIVVRSYAAHGPRARLLDTMDFFYSVYSRDCDYSVSATTLHVSLDSGYAFVSSSPAYSSRNGNELVFDLSNVTYDPTLVKIRGIYSNMKYSISDMVRHSSHITTTFAEDTADNSDTIVQKMVYSYDPNAKHSYPEGRITRELKSIRYHIEFQNEGNDDAYRVTIIDTLSLKMPVYEFQMVGSSHSYTVSVSGGNVVKWVFENIMLKPKSGNEASSKGFLTFDARVRGELRQGDSIRNKAYIYFDYNEPVVTNFSVIRMQEDEGNSLAEIHEPGTLQVYPNPARESFTIENTANTKNSISIYNSLGVLVGELTLDSASRADVGISTWAPGVYMIVNELGSKRIFVKL